MHLIKKLYPFACAIMLATSPQISTAQVSLDDLETRSSRATDEMDRLREILSSANTDQAIRAMQIVMEEGSIEQKRIALESSLASTSEAVRRTGIEAYFNAKPLIAFTFDGSKIHPNGKANFRKYFSRTGTHEENQIGRFAYRVGDYLTEQKCWAWATAADLCMFRVTDKNVILYLSNKAPGVGVIGKDGKVHGNITIPNVRGTVTYSFFVKF